MKLTSRQDIEAPMEFVYAQLVDIDQFERMAMRRGAEVERLDRLKTFGPGLSWRIRFAYKGKPRNLVVRLADHVPGSALDYALEAPTIEGGARIELMALSPRRTRMTLITDVRPRSLAARLLLQSLRLAKNRVQRRYDGAVGKLANLMEERWRASRR